MDDKVKEIVERLTETQNDWQDNHKEAATDMAYVGGDPWTTDDRTARGNRPTIAPDELTQYRNQVINVLRSNPRGMKFTPRGNGANDAGARFYQNKAREVEYRSQGTMWFLNAAENALERGYGYVRIDNRYADDRSANPEIFIDGFPNPDMVLPEFSAKRPDSGDMSFCFVLDWSDKRKSEQQRGKRKAGDEGGKGAAAGMTGEALYSALPMSWKAGHQVLDVEYWTVETESRPLWLVVFPPPPMPMGAPMGAPGGPPGAPGPPMPQGPPQPQAPQFGTFFEDEIAAMKQSRKWPQGAELRRMVRKVDYPRVKMYRSNGVELTHDVTPWPGKYIPIASCYGPTKYIPKAGVTKRTILSMTRFGRDPWKAFCYCASQELEIIGQVPKASVQAVKGQVDIEEYAKAIQVPTAVLEWVPMLPEYPGMQLPKPDRLEYLQADNLQALEVVKEGLRRSIQSSMGSNFLPTQAQKRNEKSGKALDKMDAAAAIGTYHFVYAYNGLITRVGQIFEDLCDKVYDFTGETGTIDAGQEAIMVNINDDADPDSIQTKGDYLVTVSEGPSSDSERDAADAFVETVVGNLQMIMEISGREVAAAVLAQSIRMQNIGPTGDKLADLIEPEQFRTKDGKPPSAETMQLQAQVKQLTGLLQQASQEKQSKVVEQQGKFQIVKYQEDQDTLRERETNQAKETATALTAKWESIDQAMKIYADGQAAMQKRLHEVATDAAAAAHELRLLRVNQTHDVAIGAADAAHQRSTLATAQAHDAASRSADAAVAEQSQASAQQHDASQAAIAAAQQVPDGSQTE